MRTGGEERTDWGDRSRDVRIPLFHSSTELMRPLALNLSRHSRTGIKGPYHQNQTLHLLSLLTGQLLTSTLSRRGRRRPPSSTWRRWTTSLEGGTRRKFSNPWSISQVRKEFKNNFNPWWSLAKWNFYQSSHNPSGDWRLLTFDSVTKFFFIFYFFFLAKTLKHAEKR